MVATTDGTPSQCNGTNGHTTTNRVCQRDQAGMEAYPPWNVQAMEARTRQAAPAVGAALKASPPPGDVPSFAYPPPNYKCLDSRQALLGKVVSIIGDELPLLPNDPEVLFVMRCLNNRDFIVRVRSMTAFTPLTLFDGEARGVYPAAQQPQDAPPVSGDGDAADRVRQLVRQYVRRGLFLMVEGVAFETGRMDATTIYNLYNLAEGNETLVFEEPDWWRDQITELSDAWLRGMFKTPDQVDWSLYTTNQGITFGPVEGMADQEVATLARLIYGLASAFHLTGNIRFLNAAASGIEYQRRNFKLPSADGRTVLWVSSRNGRRFQMTSSSGDDQGTIPLYEQIYALSGLAQYYRITLDPEVLADIKATVYAFKKYYYDNTSYKGFFSHIDFATKRPDAESLKTSSVDNRSRKNWNSIGDHIPAYLINTILALENGSDPDFRQECIDVLRECTVLIIDKFVDNGLQRNDSTMTMVPERFHADWQLDLTYSWQQNRGIMGHNLKIVWNLHRVASFFKTLDPPLSDLAANKADSLLQALIPEGGVDGFRGGCYDALERKPGGGKLEFTWLNTKDFWQQEQAILALLISYGAMGRPEYLENARAAQAFYNTYFLNKDEEGVYFRTNADGSAVLNGVYGQEASHAKSGYHTHENAFLSFLYNNSFVNRTEFSLYFYPSPKAVVTSINALPDFMAPGALTVESVTAPDYPDVHLPAEMLVELPHKIKGSPIQVRFKASAVVSADAPADASGVQQEPASAPAPKGKIGVLVETHYVEEEIRYFQEVLTGRGYEVVFISNLKQWGLTQNTFYGNDYRTPLVVSTDFQQYIDTPALLDEQGYKGFLLSAGYAMDRLRYEPNRKPGQPNNSFAVQFLRLIDANNRYVIGAECHGLWLYCADPSLLKGREVTCAPNVLDDVRNAGGDIKYDTTSNGGLVDAHADSGCSPAGNRSKAVLVTGTTLGSRSGTAYMTTFLQQLELLESAKA